MRVEFFNSCSKDVSLIIGEQNIIIPSRHSISIKNESNANLNFTVRCNESSRFHKGKYIISTEAKYNVKTTDESAVFVITREQTRINLNVYFERLLVSTDNLECDLTSYSVPDEMAIKHVFNTKNTLRFLLIDPFEYLTGLLIILLITGIVLSSILGWKLAVVYFPIAYLLLLTINWLSEKICNIVFKRRFKMDTEKTEFYSFFENDYITKYYSDLCKEPFMGEIEVDNLS